MSIVAVILFLLVIGFILYMLTTAPIPIHPWIKTLIVGLICFAVLIFLLNAFGVNTGINLRLHD